MVMVLKSSILRVFGKRGFHRVSYCLKDGGRPNDWKLPDLDELPGGFRGKVYNKKDWNEYLLKNTKILEKEQMEKEKKLMEKRKPPTGWRKKEGLPIWMKNKYALMEKASKIDLSKVKKLSPSTASAIRKLHDEFPNELSTDKLAEFFKVSPVAISKILKSRWNPTDKELEKLQQRWEKNVNRQMSERLIENKFEEFIEATEKRLKMEIPPFFKQELYQYYLNNSIEKVREDFDELNEARINKEKIKDEKVSKYFNDIIESQK